MTSPLGPKATLTLDEAKTMVDAAISEARRLNLAPISVAVLDAAGKMKALQTEDGVALMRPRIAIAKAWGCLGLGISTQRMSEAFGDMESIFNAFRNLADGQLVPSPGGVLIVKDGAFIGSIGISGDSGPNDQLCAVAGIEAAGLITHL